MDILQKPQSSTGRILNIVKSLFDFREPDRINKQHQSEPQQGQGGPSTLDQEQHSEPQREIMTIAHAL